MEESMKYKHLAAMAVLLLFSFPVSASMVSFLVVETGLNEEAEFMPYTGLWEGGLMDAFFDAGFIVTNSPAARMEKKPARDISGLVEDDYIDAVNGGAEYFILCFLEYQYRGGEFNPIGLALKLYKTDSKKLIYERNFPAGSGIDLDDEYKIAQNAGRAIISQVKDW